MTYMTQTIVECDRCGAQFADDTKVRQVSLTDRHLPSKDIVHRAESWTAGADTPDLCEDCADELLDQLRAFGGTLGDT